MSKVKTELQTLGLKIKELNDEVVTIHDLVDEKQDGVATDDQKARVKQLNKDIEEFEKQAVDTEDWNASQEAAATRAKGGGGVIVHPGIIREIEAKGLASQVLEDEAFKEFMAKGYGTSRSQFGASPKVEVALKTLITGLSSTSGGALVVNDRKPIIDQGVSYRALTLIDIITVGETASDSVEYVRQGTHTNNAAPVLEATSTAGGVGNKPESAMALSVVTEIVETIAHWLPATRRALADAGQLRTLIETFLRYGLMEELEDQMINGSGATPNLTGLSNVSGLTAQAFDTDLFTTYRKARRKVRTTGKATPTAFLMNPTDWEVLDLMKDNEARYYYGGPSVMGTPRMWGLPVVECEGCTAGTAYTADFKMAVLWMREQANILVSDSHSDFFIHNMIAILAEMRAAFTFLRPAALVEIALS